MRIGFRVFEQVSCKECDLFGIFQFDLKRIIKRILAPMGAWREREIAVISISKCQVEIVIAIKKKKYIYIMYVTYIAKHYSITSYDFLGFCRMNVVNNQFKKMSY